jgi:ribosomal protein L32
MLDALWRKRLVLRRPHRLSNRQFPSCRQSGHYTLAGRVTSGMPVIQPEK